jgi:hypothetical protein
MECKEHNGMSHRHVLRHQKNCADVAIYYGTYMIYMIYYGCYGLVMDLIDHARSYGDMSYLMHDTIVDVILLCLLYLLWLLWANAKDKLWS